MKSQVSAVSVHSLPHCAEDHPLIPPFWVGALLGRFVQRSTDPAGGEVSLEVAEGGGFCLASARVRNARGLDRTAFHEAAADAYRRIRTELCERRFSHPVRL